MKKLYTIVSLVITTLSATSQVIITEIADPNNTSKSRFIELTNIGQNAFDLNGYNLIRWTNSNTDPTASSEKDLSSYGSIPPGTILTFAANASEFEATYGFAPTDNFGTGALQILTETIILPCAMEPLFMIFLVCLELMEQILLMNLKMVEPREKLQLQHQVQLGLHLNGI